MATRNNRDVRMTLSVETLGVEDIKRLQDGVADLARQSGDAAPEFERLADEIGRLGEQSAAVRAFQQLADETDQLAQRQAEAAQRSDELNQKLRSASDAATQAAQRQKEAQAAFDASRDSLSAINGQLTILRNTYDESGNRVANYKQEIERLTRAKVDQKAAVDLNRRALAESNAELKDAEAGQKRYETQIKRTESTLDAANQKLLEGRTALEAQRKVTEEIGVTTDDLARAQASLVTALNSTGQAAERLRANLAFVDQTMQGSIAASERYEDSLRQQAEARERAAAAAAQEAAEERRVADLKQQIQQRLILLANERAQREIDASQRIAQEGYAREGAEFQRLQSLKEQIRNRLVALANERADREIDAAKRSAEETQKAAQAVANAFGTIGVRGVNAVQQEIQEVRTAMQTLSTQANLTGAEISGAMSAGNARIAELEREIRGLTGQLTLADRAAEAFSNSLGQIAAGNLIADAVGALVERVKEMGRQFIIVNVQADTARRALVAMYKDTEIAAQQMAFLRSTAQASGISIAGITNDFVKFSAATRTSNIPLEETNALFAAVTRAAGTLGLGADRTGLALNALAQIASKGVVSMEELRQQLGDSIPGALSLTAQGLGIAEDELIKLVEAGDLASRDFFPAFTKGLQTLQGDTDSLRNTWERFKNSLTIAAQASGEAGALELMTVALKGFGGALGLVVIALSSFVEGLLSAGNTLLFFYESLSEGRQKAWDNLIVRLDASNERLQRQTRAFADIISPADGAAQSVNALAGANGELGRSISEQAQAIIGNVESLKQQAAAANNTTLGQQALKSATDAVAKSASDGTNAWVMLNTAMTSLIETAERQIVVAGKENAAAEIQAKTVERLAALRGDERGQLEAAVQASTISIAALENEQVKRQQLVDVLTVQLSERVKLISGSAEEVAARQKEIVSLQEKINLATVEAQRSKEAVANAQAEATARALTRQTYEDNSRALDQLRVAMDAANVAAATTVAAEAEGLATKQQVIAANETAAVATALYNDSLKDLQTNLRAVNELERASSSLKEAGLRVTIAQKQAELEIAKARGENTKAAQLQNDIRKLEIELIRLGVEAKRSEAKATIAAAEADRARLEASGEMTEAQRLAIDASIKKAEVMLKEADIAEITAKKLEELDKINKRLSGSQDRLTDSFNKTNEEMVEQIGYLDRLAERSEKLNKVTTDSSGFTLDKSGNRLAMGSDLATLTGVKNFLTQAGLSEEQAKALAMEFSDGQGEIPYINNPGQIKYGGRSGTLSQALLKAAEQTTFAPTPAQPTQSTAAASVGTGTPVTINFAGQTSRVNVATAQDAQNLTSIFQQLESSASRTFV